MYKLNKSPRTGEVTSVSYQVGNVLLSIPFDPANTDYQQFLKDIKEGVELVDADGNVVTDFVKELP